MFRSLCEEADYFQSIVVSSPDCIRIIDLDGRVEFINPSGLKLFDVDQAQFDVALRGSYWPDRWSEADRPQAEAALHTALAGGSATFRACYTRRDGRSRWLDTTVSPVLGGPDRAIRRVLAISRDVTEEVESQALLGTILDCVPAALFAKEVETSRLVFLNQHAEELFGHKAEEMVGKDAHAFVLASQADAIRRHDLAAAATEGTVVVDNEIVTQKDGRTSIRRTRKKATPPGPGVRYVVCLTEDITEERGRAEALTRALEEAQAANLAKSQFLAVMSHEIRSPLNGVLGMAQAMEMGELPPDQREKLRVMREAGRLLLDLLNDMLDLSRINAGGLQLEESIVETGELARAARNLFDGLAAEKDIHFNLALHPEAAGPWSGDPIRIRQIITNLVGNAVKFTDRGSVALDIRADAGGLILAVTDTGPGIPAAKLDSIFDPFDQLDPSNTRRHGGSGLGLSICRSLAALMGGEITVASVVGEGSTFTVRLPLERAERPDTPVVPEAGELPSLSGLSLRVLAAEDNPMNQLVLSTLLGAMRIEPHIVANGQDAVEAWRREPWDLILMDVQMPVMDGPGATAAIRALESRTGRPRTPILALTANAMQHQIEEYAACGMDAVVSKPIEVRALIEAILAHTGPQAVPAPPEALTA